MVAYEQEPARRHAAIHAWTGRSPLLPPQRREHDHSLEQTEAALGEGAFAAAWQEGRAMPLEEAIAYALEEAGGV